MIEISLTQGKSTLVDDEDIIIANRYKWHALRGRNTFYAVNNVCIDKQERPIYLHRLLLGLDAGDIRQVDHVNHNGLDNRRENLRIVDHRKNQWNSHPRSNCVSKYKGVTWDKQRGKWQARCMVDGHRYCIGRFDDELSAAIAYNSFATKCFCEYAFLNDVSIISFSSKERI